jgi:hypothetical protein
MEMEMLINATKAQPNQPVCQRMWKTLWQNAFLCRTDKNTDT